jgi:hypothetical protein
MSRFVLSVVLLSSCAHTSPPSNAASVAGLHVVDLGGREVSAYEVAEVIHVFAVLWEKEGLGTQDDVHNSLFYNPLQAFIAPSEAFLCTHTADDTDHARCLGAHVPNSLTLFITRVDGLHLGCGSLVHEMAHEMLWRKKGKADGNHNKFPGVWNVGGFLGKAQFILGCVPGEGDLRTWK